MKKLSIVSSLATLSACLITGCGDSSKSPTPPSGGNASAPAAPAAPTPTEEVKKAATEAAKEVTTEVKKATTEAAAEVKKQATETVAEVQKQAVAAYQSLGSQLAASVQPGSDSLLKNIGTDLGARVTKLGDALGSNEAAKGQLNTALESLLGGKDSDAVGALGKITDSKLTPEQTTLAKDVYNAAAALVTQRNFSSLEGMNTEVTGVVNSVWKGNYTQALPSLQKIWTQAKLSDAQKNLLGTTFDKYAPGWRDSAATIQKGVDVLKGFGK